MEHKSTSKRYGKLSAEGFARGDAVVIRGVLDGKAVAYELGARIARALSPGLHPGTAAPAVGTEECDRHALQMALGLCEEGLERPFLENFIPPWPGSRTSDHRIL